MKRGGSEFVVVTPSQSLETIELYIRATSQSKFKAKVNVSQKTLIESEVKQYLILQDISILWSSSSQKDKAKAFQIIENNLKQTADFTALNLSRLHVNYFWMLHENQAYSKLLNVINKFQLEHITDLNINRDFAWLKALSLLNTGKFEKASQAFYELIKLIEDEENVDSAWNLNKEEIRATYGLSLSLKSYHSNQPIQGKKHLLEALENVEEIGDYQLVSKILYFLSSLHGFENDWENAIATLDIAEEYVSQSKSKANLFMIYNQKAMSYLIINNLSQAQDYLRKAIQELTNQEGYYKSGLYTNLAGTYETLGDYNRAIRYQLSSLDLYTKNKQSHEIAIAHNALGRLERYRGEFDKAIKYHLISISYYENNSITNQINSLIELSLDYLQKGDLESSKRYASIASILGKSKIVLGKDTTLHKLVSYSFLKSLSNEEIDSSLDRLNKLNIYSESINEFNAVKTLAHIALAERNQLLFEYYDSKLSQIYDFQQVPIIHQLDYYLLKLSYLSIGGKTEEIIQIAEEALSLIQQTRSKFDVSDLSLYWTNTAQKLLNKYIKVLSSRIDINALNHYDVNHNSIDVIFNLLEKYYAINLKERRLKSIAYSENVISGKASTELADYLSLERNSLLSIKQSAKKLADEAKEKILINTRNDSIPTSRVDSFEKINSLTIKQVQEQLKEGELLVRYFISDETSIAYLIDHRHRPVVLNLPTKEIIEEAVVQFVQSVKNKRNGGYRSIQISKVLPTKLVISNRYKKLIIIPDGILNLVPFSAINISQIDNEYQPLGSLVEIERTYSASDYFSEIELETNNNQSISVFSDPVFIQDIEDKGIQAQYSANNKLWEFNSLPYTQKEADDILELFPDSKIKLMTGTSATNQNFLADDSRNSNIIHIATHGFFNDESLENVGLATSIIDDDGNQAPGILAMREILYHPFKANLVVVSGCETTLGKHISGEGFNGLSRGFLSQGAGAVIGTIWSISDRATPVFMKEFYTNLRDMNGNVSKALNATKRSFATESKFRRYRHPYYWAGFVLTSSNKNISENVF